MAESINTHESDLEKVEKEFELESILDRVDLTKLPESLQKKFNLERIRKLLTRQNELSLLVIGRTGVGKSTIINGILGMRMGMGHEYAVECDSLATPGTPGLQKYCKSQTTVTVWDSRGLLDGSPQEVQARSLDVMVDKCSDVDMKLLCVDMSQKKFVPGKDNPDILAMIKLTDAFGVDFWRNVLIVLTFANEAEERRSRYKVQTKKQRAEAFDKKLNEWKKLLHEALQNDAGIPEEIIKFIKVVPAGHYEKWELADRDHWLSDLWFECMDALPTPEAQGAFLSLNFKRLTFALDVKPGYKQRNIEDQPIIYSPPADGEKDSLPSLSEVVKVLGSGAAGAAGGAAVGLAAFVAGPIGAAIGVPAGAVLGLCIGLALGLHSIQDTEQDTKKKKI